MSTISVCMIVKNEEKVLERCLLSLKGIWDELIIVDTGSSDATKEIARKYTDRVYDFTWIDDFSAARNYAFSKANCEYIYSADADEVLDETNRKRFLQLKEVLIPEVEIVQMWYVTPEEYNTTENFDKEYRPKLYKRQREFVWIDPIHETVRLDPVVFDSDIEIIHKPHNHHADRDFKIFRGMIDKGLPISKKLHKMYARELMLSGQKEDFMAAKDFFEQSIRDAKRGEDECQEALCVLCKALRLEGDEVSFLQYALKAVSTMPCSEICLELGIYFYEKEQYEESLQWFESAVERTLPAVDASSSGEGPLAYIEEIKNKMQGEA